MKAECNRFIAFYIVEINILGDDVKMKRGSKGKNFNVEYIDACEVEDEGFFEGDVPNLGTPIATFNFGVDLNNANRDLSLNAQPFGAKQEDTLKSERKFTSTAAKGLTPPIDGEHFTLKRGYQFRPSTLRKLNELRAKHPDVNVYLNTILDEAIQHYYDYITNKKG
jgi:hypothetical protein